MNKNCPKCRKPVFKKDRVFNKLGKAYHRDCLEIDGVMTLGDYYEMEKEKRNG